MPCAGGVDWESEWKSEEVEIAEILAVWEFLDDTDRPPTLPESDIDKEDWSVLQRGLFTALLLLTLRFGVVDRDLLPEIDSDMTDITSLFTLILSRLILSRLFAVGELDCDL